MYVRLCTYVWKKVVFIECCGLARRFQKLHLQGLCQKTVGVLRVRTRRDLGGKRFGHYIIMFGRNVKNIMVYSTCNKYVAISCKTQLYDNFKKAIFYYPEANDDLFRERE